MPVPIVAAGATAYRTAQVARGARSAYTAGRYARAGSSADAGVTGIKTHTPRGTPRGGGARRSTEQPAPRGYGTGGRRPFNTVARVAPGQTRKQGGVRYRIGKTDGWLMVAVAFLFDLAPLLIIILAVFMTFTIIGASSCGQLAADMAGAGTMKRAWIAFTNPIDFTACLAGGFSALAVGLFGGPALYGIGSIVVWIFAVMTFGLWFGMRGVNPFNPWMLVSMLLEGIPLVNVLPGISMGVRRVVRASQKEDELKAMIGR